MEYPHDNCLAFTTRSVARNCSCTPLLCSSIFNVGSRCNCPESHTETAVLVQAHSLPPIREGEVLVVFEQESRNAIKT